LSRSDVLALLAKVFFHWKRLLKKRICGGAFGRGVDRIETSLPLDVVRATDFISRPRFIGKRRRPANVVVTSPPPAVGARLGVDAVVLVDGGRARARIARSSSSIAQPLWTYAFACLARGSPSSVSPPHHRRFVLASPPKRSRRRPRTRRTRWSSTYSFLSHQMCDEAIEV